MSKFLFPVVLFFCLNANADSLDQLLKQQSVTKVSPVEFNGLYVLPKDSNQQAEDASGICSMLGYTRLVSFSTKSISAINKGDKVARVRLARGLNPLTAFWFDVEELRYSYERLDVFESVSCAR